MGSFFALLTALFTSFLTTLYLSYVSLHLFCNHLIYISFLYLTKLSTSSFHHSLPFLIPLLLSRFIPHAPLAHLVTAFLKAIHSSSTLPTTLSLCTNHSSFSPLSNSSLHPSFFSRSTFTTSRTSPLWGGGALPRFTFTLHTT